MQHLIGIIALVGLFLFIYLILSLNKMHKNKQGALIHLILAMIYTCWLPIPIAYPLIFKESSFLIIASIFGSLSLVIGIIVMIVQASHLSYSVKHGEKETRQDDINNWVLNGLIGSQVELYVGFLKAIFIGFVTTYFFSTGQFVLGAIGSLFFFINLIYLPMLIADNLNKEPKIKLNQIQMNLETLFCYTFLALVLVIS